MESQKRIVIKASLENINEIRRFATASPNFAQICETIKQIFAINAPFSIHYKDNEGDMLIISNDLELKEALCLYDTLRIFIKQSDLINPSKVIESADADKKQKTPISEPSADHVICEPKKADFKEWKPLWTTNPEVKEAREKLLAVKQRVFTARDKVTTAKKELMAAREDLFAAKKKFCEQIRIARDKKHSDNPSDPVDADSKCPKKVLARFVKHVTVPENSELPPGCAFVKTWRFRNDANKPWPTASKLQFVGKCEEDRLAEQSSYDAGTLAPGQEKDLSIKMKTPTLPGRYVSHWRLFNPENRAKFGQRVCAQVNVVDATSGSSSGSSEEESSDKKMFAESLKQLHDMGFTDQKKNLRILKRCKGDLSSTVQQLVKQLNEVPTKFTKH